MLAGASSSTPPHVALVCLSVSGVRGLYSRLGGGGVDLLPRGGVGDEALRAAVEIGWRRAAPRGRAVPLTSHLWFTIMPVITARVRWHIRCVGARHLLVCLRLWSEVVATVKAWFLSWTEPHIPRSPGFQ